MTVHNARTNAITPTATASLAAVGRYGAALAAGDMTGLAAALHHSVVWHQPGANPLSGVHEGPDAVLALLGRFMQLSSGTFRLETTATSANENFVATSVQFSAERAGRPDLQQTGTDIFRVDGGLIAEVWLFSADQAAEDAFWA